MTGNELREWRKAKGLSQSKLAAAMDVHTQTIATNEQHRDGVVSEWMADACRRFDREGKPCRK